ncbi:hypothetical protein CMV_022125 [Castanea mollissima]|uniref:Uncharacterized protein n=1 Tax=Castanea mollissima TaxID=60419 RepID=A0A8J4V8D4_9ROSI|nr:hypothetical protein CMV_022125 [Castanea mollissima]
MGGIEQPVQYEGLSSLCFGCSRVGHGVEKCQYTVRMPEGEDDDDGAGKKEESQSKPVAEKGEAFGPWVLVTQKRKQNLKPVKDKAQTSPLGALNPSPRKSQETNPFFSTLGPTIVDSHSTQGKRKPMGIPDSSFTCADRVTDLVSRDNPRHVLQTQKDKNSAQNLRSKKKSRELPIRKGSSLRSPLVWEEVSGNIFGRSLQGQSGLTMVEIREFKAGGSSSQKVDGVESVSEEASTSMEEELRLEKGNEKEAIAIINSDYSGLPLMEASAQQTTDWGPRLEADTASLSKCLLKRINPSLRSRNEI